MDLLSAARDLMALSCLALLAPDDEIPGNIEGESPDRRRIALALMYARQALGVVEANQTIQNLLHAHFHDESASRESSTPGNQPVQAQAKRPMGFAAYASFTS